VLPFLTTDCEWQDGQDGIASDIRQIQNNYLPFSSILFFLGLPAIPDRTLGFKKGFWRC